MWDEVESDFSVFHRVDDPYIMPGPLFVTYLRNLVHYRGAVRGRALAELHQQQEAVPGHRGSVWSDDRAGDVRWVDPAAAPAHAGFAGDSASGFPPVFEVTSSGTG